MITNRQVKRRKVGSNLPGHSVLQRPWTSLKPSRMLEASRMASGADIRFKAVRCVVGSYLIDSVIDHGVECIELVVLLLGCTLRLLGVGLTRATAKTKTRLGTAD
jgi:hypothetical protein